MTRKKHPPKGPDNARMLTEVELELMQAVWGLGEPTVKDVVDALPKERDLAYTTVATVMKILEKKGFLTSRRGDRAHTYLPKITKADYETNSLNHMVSNLFEGEPSSLVMRLLDNSDLSQDELKSIRKILNERMRS